MNDLYHVVEKNINRLWPDCSRAFLEELKAHAYQDMADVGINTPLRVVHFAAQISHESAGGTITHESMTYKSARRIYRVFPKYFNSEFEAEPYVGRPRKLANRVYGGRMGNRPGTDDGYDYRGRGLLQLTGRNSYAEAGQRFDLPLLSNPELVADPRYTLLIAGWEFKKLGCLEYADRDNLEKVTRRVNGGLNGLEDREKWLGLWKDALGI